MVVIIVTKQSLPDVRAEARSLLLVHRPESDSGGLCKGCYEFACHFAWWPCPQARWAQRVVHASDGGVQA
ncbi:MAG TPA: hypothetical protein DGG94_12465 [Micromonosporaceae bacterium]|nr:hypothetical protein [Micromonosporaceae bacterium]HCU50595.1 hypothetical protein [Micromonosporaceae bacterium]